MGKNKAPAVPVTCDDCDRCDCCNAPNPTETYLGEAVCTNCKISLDSGRNK